MLRKDTGDLHTFSILPKRRQIVVGRELGDHWAPVSRDPRIYQYENGLQGARNKFYNTVTFQNFQNTSVYTLFI